MLLRRALLSTLLVLGGACGGATDANRIAMPVQPAPLPKAKEPELAGASEPKYAALEPLASPACRLTHASGKTEYAVNLYVDGRLFAVVGADLTDVDVRLAEGTSGGTMSVTREGITLIGEIRANDIALELPAGELQEEWLEVRGAPVEEVEPDGTLHAVIGMPTFVAPLNEIALVVPCAKASFFTTGVNPKGSLAFLKDGINTPLKLSPSGAPVANVVVPGGTGRSPANEVTVFEKRGRSARVRIGPFDQVSYAWGWLDASVLEPPSKVIVLDSELDDVAPPPPRVRCDHDVPIFVHQDGHPLRVGVAKKGAGIPLRDRTSPEPTLDLRLAPMSGPVKYTMQAEPLLEAFVMADAVKGCR